MTIACTKVMRTSFRSNPRGCLHFHISSWVWERNNIGSNELCSELYSLVETTTLFSILNYYVCCLMSCKSRFAALIKEEKIMKKLILSMIMVGCIFLIATSVFSAGLNDFAGTWKNVDQNTRGITTLKISVRGTRVTVQAWGKCHPKDCDWGSARAYPYAPSVSSNLQSQARAVTAVFKTTFNESLIVISKSGSNRLRAGVYTRFTDNSGRSNYMTAYTLTPEVSTPLPSISYFRANPSRIQRGQSATLSWNVANAQRVSISPGSSSLPATGSRRVSPSSTTRYTLIAKNAAGEKRAQKIIQVIAPSTCTISGRVTGRDRKFVRTIGIFDPSTYRLLYEIPLDRNGRYSSSNLPAGDYRVVPLSGGKFELLSSPAYRNVRCRGDKSFTVDFDITGISEG